MSRVRKDLLGKRLFYVGSEVANVKEKLPILLELVLHHSKFRCLIPICALLVEIIDLSFNKLIPNLFHGWKVRNIFLKHNQDHPPVRSR